MKMSKIKIAVLVLLTVAVAVAVFPLMNVAYHEFYFKPWYESLTPIKKEYAHPTPFFATWYGFGTIAVWACLGFVWLTYSIVKLKQSRKIVFNLAFAALLCLTLIVGVFQVKFAQARCNIYNDVDVLMIGDEEFRAHSDWIENAENVLQDVNINRYAESNICFCIRGWLEWDSDDSETDIYYLMQEALAESGLPRQQVLILPELDFWDWGFISGSEWDAGGYPLWIDLLLIFTGQDCDTAPAMSPSMCNMSIFRRDAVNFRAMTHELGHQYLGAGHCGDPWCVMNVDWQWGDNFCSGCRTRLNANRDKWITDPEVYFACRADQGEFISPPGLGYIDYTMRLWLGRFKCGTTVTVRAEPLEGWLFDHYGVINAPFTFTQDPGEPPPPSFNVYEEEFEFTLNDTWTIVAYFVPEPVCAMKTRTDGYFYIPSIASGLLSILIIFDDSNITGDQRGYEIGEIFQLPDSLVNIHDITFITGKHGLFEGEDGWDYMADIHPDGHITIHDVCAASGHYGRSGTYSDDLAGVTITFDTGEEEMAESGFVTIPEDAASFTVKHYGTPIGAMIIFYDTG